MHEGVGIKLTINVAINGFFVQTEKMYDSNPESRIFDTFNELILYLVQVCPHHGDSKYLELGLTPVRRDR